MTVRVDDGEVLLIFPTQGYPPEWRLRRRQVEEWQALYPGLDVMDECRHALAWTQANPRQRKTARGMCVFLVNWFNKAVRWSAAQRPRPWEPPLLRQVEDWLGECHRLHAGACGCSRHHWDRVARDLARGA